MQIIFCISVIFSFNLTGFVFAQAPFATFQWGMIQSQVLMHFDRNSFHISQNPLPTLTSVFHSGTSLLPHFLPQACSLQAN